MMRGIPLSADRATFESFESRVEADALARHLDRSEYPECSRCDGIGSEQGTDEPCPACLGDGWA